MRFEEDTGRDGDGDGHVEGGGERWDLIPALRRGLRAWDEERKTRG